MRAAEDCIEEYWPAAAEAEDPVAAFFRLVVAATAKMAADWSVAGFVHGVRQYSQRVRVELTRGH